MTNAWIFSCPDMRPRLAYQRSRAFTVFDMVVTIGLFLIIAAMILPMMTVKHCACQHINCVSNLKQVNLALRIWEGDNINAYPMQVSTNLGGAKEWIEAGDVAECFRVVSNELSTTRILICPADKQVIEPTNGFGNGFCNQNISYFLGVNVTNEDNPAMLLDGDDNLAIAGTAVKPGVLDLSTNATVTWTKARHKHVGNIGFADGSVWEVNSSGLQQNLIQSGAATNQLAIP